MILLVRENLTINGTIDMNKMAPLVNDNEEAHAQESHILMLGGLTGGASGDAGEADASGAGLPGTGSNGFVFGGAPGAGSGGTYIPDIVSRNPQQWNGGNALRPPRGTAIPYTPTDTILYGAGGGILSVFGSLDFLGGAGPGGSGAATTYTTNSDGSVSNVETVRGLAGDAIGGGAVYIFVGGSVTIGSNGVIRANGGNGANGVSSYNSSSHRYAMSGGGSGAGGGVVALIYRGAYTNNGTVTAAGGTGGSGVTYQSYSSQAGENGSDGTVLVSSIFDIINNE